ncbi:MAG: hypothetical protein IKM13_06960 [Clostridia bacterium]|nr:hypothetical protein [Clostridia bacterium]
MKKLWIFLIVGVSILLSACDQTYVEKGKNDKIQEQTEPTAHIREETTEEGQNDYISSMTFLEKEKLTDPIFDWEDPYTEEEFLQYETEFFSVPEEERTQKEKDKYSEYVRMRAYRMIAEENYPMYYYYYSGNSEYDGTLVEGHRNDTGEAFASYHMPQSFILNMKADCCVVMQPVLTYSEIVQNTYMNEAEKKKEEADGAPETHEVRRILMKVESSIWGDMEEDFFVLTPRLIGEETIKDLSDTDNEFVAFLYRHDEVHEVDGAIYQEYGLRTRGLFSLEEGKLHSYSNIADIVKYDGESPETMIAEGILLAEKYPEIINMKFS